MKRWAVRKEIRVWGIQRSGNHAIINWITKQSDGSVFFLNHGDPLSPFDTHRDFSEPPQPIGLFIHSYENYRFSPPLLQIADVHRSNYYEIPNKSFELLIMRDAFNLFASRMKSGYVRSGRDDRYNQADLWLCYADEYLNKTNHLGANKLVINYNRWCKDFDYRKALAQRLGLVFTDAGFNDVSGYGGGSSFDGVNLKGRASSMQTDERWKHYRDDASFRNYFCDPLITKANEEIFGEIEGTRDFVNKTGGRTMAVKAWIRGRFVRNVVMPLIDFQLWLDRKHFL